jgi:histidinol phosphatase-like enzyme
VYFFFPETNGLHLEEVDQIFRDSKTVLDPVKMAAHLPRDALVEPSPTAKPSQEMLEHKV